MRCPSVKDWDSLAMELLEREQAERMLSHARGCATCRERFQAARRAHIDRVRMYEAFDREHDALREELMAALAEEAPGSVGTGWVQRGWWRLGGFAMSLNKTAGRRAAAVLVPAACIVIAVVVFLAPKQSAFAAALEHMRQAQTIVSHYQVFMGEAGTPMMQGKLYLSNERGMRFDVDVLSDVSPLGGGATFQGGVVSGSAARMTLYREPEGPMVMVQPPLNIVIKMHGLDQVTDDPRRTSPDMFIQRFLEMAEEADHDLGITEIDGHQVQGFEVSASKLGLEFPGSGWESGDEDASPSGAARLWVDVDTDLPVRMEVALSLEIAGGRMLAVYDQFEWDVPVADDVFVLEIPEGMREIELTLPPLTEATLLEGLKLFVDAAGRYPVSLDPTNISVQFSMAYVTSGRIEIDPADPAGALTNALVDDALKVSMACAFVQQLAADGHEPEYFGDVVTPEDADEVLVHWKLDDGRMRVIYGDLRVETVVAGE